MSTKRKLITSSLAGITLAVIIIAAIYAGMQLTFATGTLKVSLKDAPVDLTSLVMTVSSVQIQKTTDQTWITLDIDEEKATNFDLLALTGEKNLILSEQIVAAGDYSKIRLEVTDVSATTTDRQDVTPVNVPSGHIDIIVGFTVSENKVTDLLIDMQPDQAAISASGNFKPTIKMTITPPA
jgi:hypothetical protein